MWSRSTIVSRDFIFLFCKLYIYFIEDGTTGIGVWIIIIISPLFQDIRALSIRPGHFFG